MQHSTTRTTTTATTRKKSIGSVRKKGYTGQPWFIKAIDDDGNANGYKMVYMSRLGSYRQVGRIHSITNHQRPYSYVELSTVIGKYKLAMGDIEWNHMPMPVQSAYTSSQNVGMLFPGLQKITCSKF